MRFQFQLKLLIKGLDEISLDVQRSERRNSASDHFACEAWQVSRCPLVPRKYAALVSFTWMTFWFAGHRIFSRVYSLYFYYHTMITEYGEMAKMKSIIRKTRRTKTRHHKTNIYITVLFFLSFFFLLFPKGEESGSADIYCLYRLSQRTGNTELSSHYLFAGASLMRKENVYLRSKVSRV